MLPRGILPSVEPLHVAPRGDERAHERADEGQSETEDVGDPSERRLSFGPPHLLSHYRWRVLA